MLTDNYAYGYDGGGAIYARGDDATLTVTGSEVSNNIADGRGGGIRTSSYLEDVDALTISDTDVIDNIATDGEGGGIDIGYLYGDGVIGGGARRSRATRRPTTAAATAAGSTSTTSAPAIPPPPTSTWAASPSTT